MEKDLSSDVSIHEINGIYSVSVRAIQSGKMGTLQSQTATLANGKLVFDLAADNPTRRIDFPLGDVVSGALERLADNSLSVKLNLSRMGHIPVRMFRTGTPAIRTVADFFGKWTSSHSPTRFEIEILPVGEQSAKILVALYENDKLEARGHATAVKIWNRTIPFDLIWEIPPKRLFSRGIVKEDYAGKCSVMLWFADGRGSGYSLIRPEEHLVAAPIREATPAPKPKPAPPAAVTNAIEPPAKLAYDVFYGIYHSSKPPRSELNLDKISITVRAGTDAPIVTASFFRGLTRYDAKGEKVSLTWNQLMFTPVFAVPMSEPALEAVRLDRQADGSMNAVFSIFSKKSMLLGVHLAREGQEDGSALLTDLLGNWRNVSVRDPAGFELAVSADRAGNYAIEVAFLRDGKVEARAKGTEIRVSQGQLLCKLASEEPLPERYRTMTLYLNGGRVTCAVNGGGFATIHRIIPATGPLHVSKVDSLPGPEKKGVP